MRLFFDCFFSKGSPFKFFDILQQTEVWKSPKGLPFQVFRHSETRSKFLFFDFSFFFRKFYTVFNFYNILQYNRYFTIPKGPPFRFFGTMRLFKILIFCLKLGFLSIYLPIFFSITIWNLDVISWVKRYIRIFDVISESYSILPRRRLRFEKRSHLGQHAISEVWDVTTRNKLDFQKTQRVPPFTISKSLSFLSLRYGADFRRSRLVFLYR